MKILLLINLLLIASAVNSEITDVNEKFTLLCEVEKSTGFNWKKGDWYQTNFITGQKYIIKKHDKPLSVDSPDYDSSLYSENSSCSYGQKKNVDWIGSLTAYGCYSIKKFGEKSKYRTCREEWGKVKQSQFSLNSVNCEAVGGYEWKISPNGWFHRGSIHSTLALEPEGYVDFNGVVIIQPDYKDSLSITVGKCSEI